MRTSVKSFSAAVIVLALCVVPLLASDSSEAGTIATGESAASYSNGGMSEDDFNDLFTDAFKEGICMKALESVDVVTGHDEGGVDVYDYDITDISITDIKEIKCAMGHQVAEDSISDSYVRTFRCDISFTATRTHSDGILFSMDEGMQNLYKALDYGNVVKVGSVLKMDGELRLEDVNITKKDIVENAGSDYVITRSVQKSTSCYTYRGFMDYVYDCGGEVEKRIGIDTEYSYGGTTVVSIDYDGVPANEVTGDTVTIRTVDYGGAAQRYRYMYRVGDVDGGYDYKISLQDKAKTLGPELHMAPVTAGTASELGTVITGDITVSQISFYSESGDMGRDCLFNGIAINNAAYKSDDALKERLGQLGSVGDTYADAKSNAESAYGEVIMNPVLRVSGLAALVAIGVLATVVVVLTVLLIRKK